MRAGSARLSAEVKGRAACEEAAAAAGARHGGLPGALGSLSKGTVW
jgi:hypothetical protein